MFLHPFFISDFFQSFPLINTYVLLHLGYPHLFGGKMNTYDIEKYNRNNLILWASILLAMGVMCIVTYALYISHTFTPIQEITQVKNILFLIAIILAVGILFLKRSFFSVNSIVNKVKASGSENHQQSLLMKLKTNYIIIWAMGEMILILGFIEFILIADINSFLIYAVVGFYAVIINYPHKDLITKCMELLSQSQY